MTDRTTFITTNPRHAPAAVDRRDRQTDGRTRNDCIDTAAHIMPAVSKITVRG